MMERERARRLVIAVVLYMLLVLGDLLVSGSHLRMHVARATGWLVILGGTSFVYWGGWVRGRGKLLVIAGVLTLGSWLTPYLISLEAAKYEMSMRAFVLYLALSTCVATSFVIITNVTDRLLMTHLFSVGRGGSRR